MQEQDAFQRSRIVVPNTTLEEPSTGKKWVVTLVQLLKGERWFWVLNLPTPKKQVAIPFPESAIDRLTVVKK